MSDCKHRVGPFCHLGYFNGKPTAQDCFSCEAYSGRSRGLGDYVAKFFKFLRIDRAARFWSRKTGKTCNCKKRQASLNAAMPLKRAR